MIKLAKYVRNTKAKIRKENEGFAVYVPLNGVFWFNEEAMEIFNLVSSYDVDSISAILASKYNISDTDKVKKDIVKTIDVLEMTGCVQLVG